MILESENTNKPLALVLSLVFHGLLILLFYLVVMHTPIPPYPEVGGGSGLEVNFGNSDQGTGEIQPEELIPIETQNLKQAQNQAHEKGNVSQDENIMTQHSEEAPEVKTSPKKETKPVKEIVKINDPVINPNALYKKQNGKKGGSEGETGKPGDQGNIKGSLYAKNHYGNPGTGGGDGGGSGTGIGGGTGPGIGPSYNLNGRIASKIPKPDYNSHEQGTVVVKIWVSKDGVVTRAESGAKGTTTSSETLQRLARQAAMKARFSANPNAPEEQKGTITYHFVVQN